MTYDHDCICRLSQSYLYSTTLRIYAMDNLFMWYHNVNLCLFPIGLLNVSCFGESTVKKEKQTQHFWRIISHTYVGPMYSMCSIPYPSIDIITELIKRRLDASYHKHNLDGNDSILHLFPPDFGLGGYLGLFLAENNTRV